MKNVIRGARAFGMGVALWLLLASAHAQNIAGNCKQFNPNGNMTCDLSPPVLSPWVYSAGYGGDASTDAEALLNFIAVMRRTNTYCSMTPTVGPKQVALTSLFYGAEPEVRTFEPFIIKVSEQINGTCGTPYNPFGGNIYGTRTASCNPGFEKFWDPGLAMYFCGSYSIAVPPQQQQQSCRQQDGVQTGDPIIAATGDEVQTEVDLQGESASALSFVRTYRSIWVNNRPTLHPATSLGNGWSYNHLVQLVIGSATANLATITTGEGYSTFFTKATGAAAWKATGGTDTLVQSTNGGWTWHRAGDDTAFNFNASGVLQSSVQRNGWTTVYTYNAAGQLATISNGFGRSLTLGYSAGRLTTVTRSDGRVVSYAYDSTGRLTTVTYPDGKSRGYVYENASFTQALTGVIDEAGGRFATIAYDAQGNAVNSQLAGGVDNYHITDPGNNANVTDPLGTTRNYGYSTAWGQLAVTFGSLASAHGDGDAARRTVDTNGLTTSETDFKGVITTTAWDTVRRLPLTVVRAAGTPEAQTVTTQWHATFALPTVVAEAGRTTAFTYDGLGNRLSQAITDTLASPNATRTWQWTYNAQQLVASETAPNGGVTRYTYDALGNVITLSNALGHLTTYAYDSGNRVATRQAPNNLVTSYTWDAKDRLLTQVVGGQQTTTLTYTPSGQLATLSLPTGLALTYGYDAAHRLTGWTNNRAESGTFTLDAMGNRVAEQVKNALGAVAWSSARTINSLNRLASDTQGGSQSRSFSYDTNGELVAATNGLSQRTTYDLDGLRRITAITDASNAVASLGYNALDDLTLAKDFKGVATNYARNAQGDATTETSADTGMHVKAYDALGLPHQIVDALGQATTVSRDLLGRPTQLAFADGKRTTLAYDATTPSKGYLSSIVDRSGTTIYTRDAFGRVTVRKQTLASGAVSQVGYSYTVSGLLAGMTYPNKVVLQNVYDATGRLSAMNWGGKPLITNIVWNPLGQPLRWTWAFADSSSAGLNALRSYDTAGRLTTTEFSSYVYDAAGRITGLTQSLLKPADAVATNSSVTSANSTWAIGYDAPGRITSFNVTLGTPANSAAFTYDANGNRLTSSSGTGQTTSRNYTLPATGNRATGFSQTIGSTTSTVSYAYNANGDLTGDGLNSFSYDAEGRMNNASAGRTDSSPTSRYVYNALGQRVFKTVPVYPAQNTVGTDLTAFQSRGWNPSGIAAEMMGTAFTYDEEATLIAQTSSAPYGPWSVQYVYLPTASGPMPVAAVMDSVQYAVQADHLNTPRRLTSSNGQVMWQWGYSAFGEEAPTTAARRFMGPSTAATTGVTFNLRFPGQYADSESGLSYNGFRSYNATTGRYTQGDPIGLNGGWNRFGYVGGNPLMYSDKLGLVSLVGQVGGAFVAGLGVEGNVGAFLNLSNGRLDIGFYGQGGLSAGLQGGVSAQLGVIKGDVSTLRGVTKNLNASVAPYCATLMMDDNKKLIGFTVGPAAELGGSLTYSDTGVWSLSESLGRLFDRVGHR